MQTFIERFIEFKSLKMLAFKELNSKNSWKYNEFLLCNGFLNVFFWRQLNTN
jgi:hypothetical protein